MLNVISLYAEAASEHLIHFLNFFIKMKKCRALLFEKPVQ